ncbi:MAG TPA: hypothetical protein VJ953_21750 [Saprospiraceae bacterium]|nr:hypothetical protein [Saprospiraceae bacterium]
MKYFFMSLILLATFSHDLSAQQTRFKVVTVIESIVPGGLGRSRIIEEKAEVEVEDMTTERTDGKSSNMKEVKRRDLKIDNFEETKLLNFYSIAGINFQNIASNDAIISEKLNALAAEGWELMFMASGVESSAGGDDTEGIFITRFLFKRIR